MLFLVEAVLETHRHYAHSRKTFQEWISRSWKAHSTVKERVELEHSQKRPKMRNWISAVI